ncbi:MAG: PAS domain S-box protein [Nitrospirae bacterium]|nr:PAS domain S-box protein [Nitrospirota bacterium]
MSDTMTKTARHFIPALPVRAVLPLIAALSALPVLVVAAFPSYLNIVVDKASYLVFHNVVEFFSIMVSLSIFGVGWFSYDQTKDRHALFLSCSFLAIGLIDFMHTLGNAAMPDLITPNSSNKSTQFWIAGRLFQGAVFLASAFIYAGSQKRWLTKTVLMTSTLLATGAVFAGVTFFPSYIPDTYVPGAGLTPFKKISEFLVIVLLSAAAIAYWRRMVKTGDRVALYYLAAFIIGIFSEISFAVYTKVFDTYNVLGHIYKVAAFFAIYKGIFIASVMEPYKRLRDVTVSRDEMEKEVRERIQTEKALMESEAKYRNLFNSMDEGFCIIEMIFDERARPVDYRFLEVNAAFEKQTGLQEVTGRSIRELAPANEAYWFEIYGNIALTGQPMRFINEAGALNRWYDVHAYRVGKPEDRHVAILFNDISRQKQIEEALSKAHDELELHVNERTGELKEAEARLRELNETLEQRVAERTAQLKAANASLVDSRRATLNMMEDALASSKNSRTFS